MCTTNLNTLKGRRLPKFLHFPAPQNDISLDGIMKNNNKYNKTHRLKESDSFQVS